jgi:hypothetical protein
MSPPPLPTCSLRNFFRRASDMIYFKRLIQIPRLPEVPCPSPSRGLWVYRGTELNSSPCCPCRDPPTS